MAGSTNRGMHEFWVARRLPSVAVGRGHVQTAGIAIGSLLFMVVVWEIAVRFLEVRPVLLPGPVLVLQTLWERWDLIVWENTWPTVVQALWGFALAVVVGIAIGVGVTYSSVIRSAVYPLIVGTQTMPKVAVAPLFVIWLGLGDPSRIALAFFVAFFPMVVNTTAGLQSVDDGMIRMARSFCGSRWKIFCRVRLPNSLPYIFSGMKISITLSIIGVIVAEFVTAQKGLGYLVVVAQGMLDTPLMMATLLVLAVVGLVLFGAIIIVERWCIYWGSQER